MPYCRSCGAQVQEYSRYCPKCGSPVGYSNSNYQQMNAAQYDSGSIWWAVLGFLIPLVGLILFIVWMDNKPNSAKMAGIGALVSVILSVLIVPITVIIMLGIAGTATNFI